MVEESNAGIWGDSDQVTVNPGVQKPRAVVSVSYSRDEFNCVTRAAQSSDMKTSEFIRTASLEKATATTKVTLFELKATGPAVGFITVMANIAGGGTSVEPPKYKSHDEQFFVTAP